MTDPVALLLIDIQRGLDEPRLGRRNNPDAERNVARLLAKWRARGRPVVHVRHMSTEPDSPLRPELPGNTFKAEALPADGEPVFEKKVNSTFIGTDLERHLRDCGIVELVVVGLTTDHCVSSTARMASDLGFRVTVVSDATATHERTGPGGELIGAEEMHRAALASLSREFAAIRTTGQVLADRPGAGR